MATNFIAIEGTCFKAQKKVSKNGNDYMTFSLVHNRPGVKVDDKWTNKSMWFNCRAFGNINMKWFPDMEDKVRAFVTGIFETNEWTNKEGEPRVSLEIMVNDMQVLGPQKEKRHSVQSPGVEPAKQKKATGDADEDFPF